jgi:hypothetical protein
METTFVISKTELNNDFLDSLKKLFKHQKQIQISVSVAEDFNLLQTETPRDYLDRLEKCLADMNSKKSTITFTETQLDDIIFEIL